MAATVSGFGVALPPPMSQAGLWSDFFRAHYGDSRLGRQVFATAGIETRRGVVNPAVEDISRWRTEERMRRFTAEAIPLGKKAVTRALEASGVDAADLGMLVVASSTGYVTPGVDIMLARDLAMAPDLQRLHIGHMGCYAALPALGAATDFVHTRGRPAVVLAVELTSLHIQPASDAAGSGAPTPEDREQIIAHALFGDAAAAVVVRPGTHAGGMEVVDLAAVTDTATASEMTWEVTDHGFRMGLSPRVPDVLARHSPALVTRLLGRHGLTTADVTGWAIHPGGRRIGEAVGEALTLAEDDVRPAYRVLRDHGNCSSATVLLVLEEVLATREVPSGGWIVAMTFGPGLTMYAALLRHTT